MTDRSSVSATWENLRTLYGIYGTLARESVIEMQPCPELENALDVPSAENIAEAEKWVAAMDAQIQPHQLRQFLQTSGPMDGDVLHQLVIHYLGKPHTELDRDKIDFLLVQLFSQRAASDVSDAELNFDTVAQILQPVLGVVEARPEWLAPLDDLLSDTNRAHNLNWLFTHRIIERGRELKHSCGEKFFEPAALVAFARFGFLLRRRFFRLMHQDLNAILDGLRGLESRGIATLDCRKAQFSAEEPIARLQMICQSWKVMFHAEYSSGQPLCILVDLRTAVEAALAKSSKSGESEPELKTQAAVASGAGAAPTVAAEFEIAAAPSDWNPEGTEA